MSKRDIGQEILDGIRDVKAYKAGTKVLRVHTLKEPAPPQIIRSKLKVIVHGVPLTDSEKTLRIRKRYPNKPVAYLDHAIH